MGITGEYKLFSVTQANQSRRGSLAEGYEFCMHPSELGEIINFNVCHKRWPGLGVGVRLSGIVFMVCWVMGLTSPDFLTDSVCFEIFNESALQFFFLYIPSKEHLKLTTPESSKPSYVESTTVVLGWPLRDVSILYICPNSFKPVQCCFFCCIFSYNLSCII